MEMSMDAAQKERKKGYKQKKKDRGSLEFECLDEACGRTFLSETAAEDHALAVHTHDEVRQALGKALRAKFAGPPRQWTWIDDTADDWFVYALEVPGLSDDKLFRQEFTFSDGVATLVGDPVEVRRRTVYEPVTTASQ
jgi:hypothetical protein